MIRHVLWELASACFQGFQSPYGSEVPEMYLVLNEAEIIFYMCGLRNLSLKQVQHCSTPVNFWDKETTPGSIVLPLLPCTAPIIRRERWKLLQEPWFILCVEREFRVLGKGILRDLHCLSVLPTLVTLPASWLLVLMPQLLGKWVCQSVGIS